MDLHYIGDSHVLACVLVTHIMLYSGDTQSTVLWTCALYCALVIHNVLNSGCTQCAVLKSKFGSSCVLDGLLPVTADASAACFVFDGNQSESCPGDNEQDLHGSSLLWHLCTETCQGVCPGALEGRIVWGVNRKPRTLSSARGNIMAALGHLGMLTAQTCPTGLLHEVEHVLQVRLAQASLVVVCTQPVHFLSRPHHLAVVPF